MNTITKNGSTPLHSASYYGHDSTIRVLHELSANVDSADNDGSSPLHLASLNGHDSTIHILHELGASVDPVDNEGLTPLHDASLNGHDSTIRVLHELGADPSGYNKGETPLKSAVKNGHALCVRYFISNGVPLKSSNIRSNISTFSPPVQAVLTEAINGEQPFIGSVDNPTACFSLMKLISSTHIGQDEDLSPTATTIAATDTVNHDSIANRKASFESIVKSLLCSGRNVVPHLLSLTELPYLRRSAIMKLSGSGYARALARARPNAFIDPVPLLALFADPGVLSDVLNLRLTCRCCGVERRFPVPLGGSGSRSRGQSRSGSVLKITALEVHLIESYVGGDMSWLIPTGDLSSALRLHDNLNST